MFLPEWVMRWSRGGASGSAVAQVAYFGGGQVTPFARL